MAMTRLVGRVVVLLLASAPLSAQADPPVVTVGTHSMTVKDDPLSAVRRKFSFNVRSGLADPSHQSAPPAPGSAGDPTVAGASGGGAVLTLYNSAGSGEQFTVVLPAAQWHLQGDPAGQFRYVFASTPPIWKVYVKGPKISVRGGKTGWGYTLDEPSQGRLAVRLTLGTGVTFCSDAAPRTAGAPPSSVLFDRPGKFQAARLQAAPDSCPPLP